MGFQMTLQRLSYLGKITPVTLWQQYHTIIEKVNLKELFLLPASCVSMFSRLKVASLKNRLEKSSHEVIKKDIVLNPDNAPFDCSKFTSSLQNLMSQQSLACKVTEELALVTSLRLELETFVLLTADNNLRIQASQEIDNLRVKSS